MIRYQRLPGVTLGATSNPSIQITPEGRAMGAVPGWDVLLDPDYASGPELLNRAQRGSEFSLSSIPGGIALGSFANGEKAFDSTEVPFRAISDVGINPDSWSVVAVLMPEQGGQGQLLVGSENLSPGEIRMRVGLIADGTQARIESSSAGSVRLSYNADFVGREQPTVLTFTSSTRDGLKIYDNGALAASDPSDKDPLTRGYGPGEWSVFRYCRGNYGVLGVLSIDLGWPEHAGYRRAIERFLMDKYGISGAA